MPKFEPLTEEQLAKVSGLVSDVLNEKTKEQPTLILAALPYHGSFTRCFHHKGSLEDVIASSGKILGAWSHMYAYWCTACRWAIQGVVLEVTPYEQLILGTRHKFAEHALRAEAFYGPVKHDLLVNRIWEQLLGKVVAGRDIDMRGGTWCEAKQPK